MKIALLSREKRSYSTKRLKEACTKRGHLVRILNTLSFSMHVEQESPNLLYQGRRIPAYDAVIPRIGASITFFGTAVVRQFEQMGVFCVNSSLGITVSRDKLRAIQALSRHDIGIPFTAFVRQRSDVMPAIKALGGAPVVIKLLEGTQGIGVILADTDKVAEAIVETLQSARQNVLIQKFVKESQGKDIRAIVVGGKVVAAMRRKAQSGEFRSNVHRGGSVEAVALDAEYQRTAVRAAHIMGLNVAGVDMLEGVEGPKVLEVNSSPGLEGIEKSTKVDVAGAIVEYLEQQVLFPEIDIRERLMLSSGYGVVEIPVDKESPFKNKTVADTGLRQMDIVVLRILRESQSIPNPRPTREILVGDALLCFGKLESVKTLLPKKSWRQKREKK